MFSRMAEFEAGTAYVGLLPSAKGFSQKAKRELADVDLSKSVDLDADKSKLEAAVQQVREQLKSLDREKANPSIDFDVAVAQARIDEVNDRLEKLGKQEATPKVALQTANAKRELNTLQRQLEEVTARRDAVDVDADISAATATLRELESKLDEVNRLKAEPQVLADTVQAKARLAEVQSLLQRLAGTSVSPEVDLQVARAQQEALRIQAELERLGAMRPSPEVDADISALSAKLAVAQQQLAEIDAARVTPEVTADTSSARAELAQLELTLRTLDATNASPEVRMQAAQAQQEVLRIRADLDRLGAMAPSPQVDADIASATAKLAMVNQQLRGLGDKTVHVNASGNAGIILTGVLAALGSIIAVAPAAAAALANVAGAAGAIGQGAAAGIAGFSGIGDALKALEADEKSAATASASSSNTRAAAAKQVESAQRQLGQAQQQAARSAITGAQQVADAERSLQQSSVAAGRARIQADQQVAAARRAVSDAVVSANARVASAERSLESAQRSRQYAQERLTDAVRDATRAQRDLNMQVAGAALSEERATLSLAQARQRLAESTTSDPLERADLALSVREAEQNLKEVQTRYGDLRSDQAEWARGGVAGSRQVRDATRAVEDAQRGVQDAARGVTEAQVQGARQVADAQQSLAQAQQQAAWSVQDAQRGVADAQLAVGRAAQQAAWQQQDAAAAVADAQRALADAYTQGGEAAAGGAKQAEYALGKLTPAGRSIVEFLKGEFEPAWKRTTDSVAEAMLPKVEQALRNVLGLESVVKTGLTETGSVLGDLAIKGSELATSPPFQANFASIMASNNRQLRAYGDAGLNLFGAFTDLYAAAGPINEEFARNAQLSSEAFETWVIGARASGELERWLQQAADTLEYLGGWLVDVGGDVVGFASSLAPLGVVVLEVVRGITDWVSWLAQLSPGLTSTAAGAGLAAVAASKLGTAMKDMAIAQGAAGLSGFANVASTVFNPAALYATGTLSNLRGGFDKAGVASSTFVQKVTGSGVAATATAGGFQTAGRAVTGLAAGLPLLAAAFVALAVVADSSSTSIDEATESLEKGGAAARATTEAIQAQNSTPPVGENWINDLNLWMKEELGLATSVDQARAELEKKRNEMTGLEAAQSRLTEANGNYSDIIRRFGPDSAEARAAQQDLANKSADVAREQDNARRATMNATQALQDQQNQILGSIDARLALRQQTQQVAQAQKDYDEAVRSSGPGSDEATAAQTRLEQAQSSQAAAAVRAAEAEAKRKGIVDSSALANQAYAQSVGDMVAKTEGQLTPSLTEMVQGLDAAGLSAAGAKVHIDDAGNAVATFPNGKTVTLTSQTSPEFFTQLQAAKDAVNSTRGTIGVDVDTGPGEQKVGGFKLRVDQTTGVVGIDGNINPAEQQRLGIKAKTDGTTGTMFINGNPVPCDGSLNGMRVKVDQTTGVMTIDADPAPANADSADAHARANAPAGFPIGADAAGARRESDIAHDFAGRPITFGINADTKPAEGAWDRFWGWLNQNSGFAWTQKMLGRPGYAQGGLVEGYATGGAVPGLTHKQVIRGFAAGASGSNRVASSDTVPAMLTPGEFVIRKRAVDAIGLPTLNALNGMALGGVVGFASGGPAKPKTSGGVGATAVTVPTGDAGAAAGAAGATDALTGSMTEAGAAAEMLAPQLAAVTAEQQAMTTGGVTPLAGAITGTLAPALGVYAAQVGVAAPLANTALQTSQAATQLSTSQTAANTAVNAGAMTAATTGMSLVSQAQHAGLRAGQVATQVSASQTAANAGMNNAAMAATTTGMSLAAQGQHAGLRAGQAATQVSTNLTAANAGANNANITATTTGMSLASQAQHAGLRAAHGLTQGSNVALAQNTAGNNVNMEQTTGNMSGTNQGHLAGLRGAQGVTTGATTAFADSWRDQLGRTVPDSANPLRHVITVPIRGIVDAWNTIDGQFALGKHVPPPAANFATGGRVPGTGNGDTVPAMLTPGEYVISKPVVKKWGIGNINAAHQAARNSGRFPGLEGMFTGDLNRKGFARVQGFAHGGAVLTPGGPMGIQYRAVGGAIDNARRVAASMNGKKYVYGGGSAAGTDCSGYVAFVTRALNMDPNPYRRIGTTASFPWGGFAPGLKSAWSVGNTPGVHMAGTLAGTNVESGGAHGTSAFGGPAVGADNSQFPGKWHLPQIGGTFVSGGSGDGSGFDFVGMVREAFKWVFEQITKVPQLFGPSDQVARAAGIPRVGADLAINKIIEKLSSMFAGSGGGVPDAALANLIIGIGKGMGFPRKGPEVALATAFQESGLRNINYGDRDSLGVFQQRPSMGWGTPQQIMDPRYSAGKFYSALRGVRGWESMPHTVAAQRVQRSAFPDAYAKWVGRAIQLVNSSGIYDTGGVINDGEAAVNLSGFPERVLQKTETRSYDTLTRLVGKNGVRVELGDFTPQASGPAVQIGTVMTAPGETATGMAKAITWQVRTQKRGGVYA